MSWLSGYTCQKKCTVVATAAGAQTNYQLELKVGESSGAAGEDVDCENCCEDFPNDIRFTKEDGETKHDYWIESVTGTTPNQLATVIIEIASVPISGSVDFYMYYGKSGDSGESNIANTFIREINSGQPVVGAWSLNGNALDTSGNGNNGTLNGGMGYTTGKFWQACLFDGGDDYIGCGTDPTLDITDAITIEAWIKPGSNPSVAPIITKGCLWSAYALNIRNDLLQFQSYRLRYTAYTFTPGTWYHVAGTFGDGYTKIYINGVEEYSRAETGSISSVVDALCIGWDQDDVAPTPHFDGVVDECKIYNRVLTGPEISDIYGSGGDRYGYTTINYPGRCLVRKYASPEPTWGSWGVANKEIHSPDVGTGTDIALGVQGALLGTDVGAGVDAILAALSARLEADVGAGVDVLVELLKVIAKYDSDVGVGIDTDIEYRHGSGSLAGSEGVAVMHNLNIVNYQPEIYVAEESGAIGEIWITDIGTNSFVVRNSGDAKISFDWVIYAGEIAPGYNGSGNLAGTSGITIAHNLGVANYLPAICITEESGAIGEVWITDIGTNSFVVRNSGDAEVSFNWVICETDVEADHRGNANLAGTSGVTIAHNLDLAFYQFQLAVTEESGAIGEIWITDIGTNSFVVRNSGDARVAFSWVIYDITRSDILATLFEAETGIGIDELSCLLGSLENAEIGSGLEEAKLILTSSDLGIGIDELCSLLGNLENADVGTGADAISEILGMLQEADGGSGLEEAKLILTSSDVGVGIDELASLLGTISDSDLGSGIEAEIKVVWIYLMLKLLQEKKLNIKLSQGDES